MSQWANVFNLYYDNILELVNGVVFVLVSMMALALSSIMLRRFKKTGEWRDTIAQLTTGMILFKIGLGLGFGYRWLVVRCSNAKFNCVSLEGESWVLFVSVAIIMVGGLMIIRVLSPIYWRPWSWLGTLIVSLLIPFAYYAFDVIFPTDTAYGPILYGSYAVSQVVLSILLAIVGSYVALDVAARAQVSTGIVKAAWMLSASIVMGGSIWAMHFIAMLAFDLPLDVSYDLGITLLSLLVPIALTLIALVSVATSKQISTVSVMFGGTVMGLGIVFMHYTGMSAMIMQAEVTYDLLWVGISVIIAIVASTVAVMLVFADTTPLQKLLASFVMGIFGISGLHYSGMVALICREAVEEAPTATVRIGMSENQLTLFVSVMTVVILSAFFAISTYDRLHQQQNNNKKSPTPKRGA